MIKKVCLPLMAAVFSSTVMAGTPHDKILFLEAGLAYSHTFFKGSVMAPESGGFSYDPDNHYPNDYWGGYFGLSYYSNCWLFNSRFDIFAGKDKREGSAPTHITFAPVRLSFTVDRVFGDIHTLSYGLGAGVAIENLNKGTFITDNPIHPGNEASHSLDGRTRIDPLIEGFIMKQVSDRIGIKLNAAYQIPAHNRTARGDLNMNLGITYSFS